jgi:scyllo-inositol 2-dehydrogenase (NADP+)
MNVAIVGFGLAGRVFHAPLVDAVDGLNVATIVTGSDERAAQARAAYPDARVVATVGDAWAGADVVVIATPNRFHAPLALAAIERGIPVVVDKPLATSAEEAERILGAGGRVTVFQNRRWDGDFLTVRRLVEEGALGHVVRFASRFERFRPQVTEGSWRELGDPAEGGGQLLDLGAHLVDQARLLFGHPLRVYAEIDVRRPGGAADDDVFVALEHAGGVRSHLSMGTVAPLPAPRFSVSGLRGGCVANGLDPQEPQLAGGMTPREPGYGERDEPGRIVSADGGREVAIERGRYEEFYAGVRAWLTGGGPPPVDPRDSLDGLRVLEAARRSAATRTVIDLEDTPT